VRSEVEKTADNSAREVVVIEPYYGGSHRAAAEGWARWSRHRVAVESLPARFWKWRMRGAAFEMARRVEEKGLEPDAWFASSTVDAAHFLALTGGRTPLVLYFHENQAAYPGREGEGPEERDLQYIFTDLASALAADRVAFNSVFQRDAFFEGMEEVLRRMPDARPLWALDRVRGKSSVVPLGVELSDIDRAREEAGPADGGPPIILWNHRWEYDKAPETFFDAVTELAREGVPFRLAVAGERFSRIPEVFARCRSELADRILHWGYAESRADYVRLLVRADIAVSTARQENFGISMVEAAYAGAHPLAPRRLAYPEVFDDSLHGDCLYDDPSDLVGRLRLLLSRPSARIGREGLRTIFGRYDWRIRAAEFDDLTTFVSRNAKM
jgi:glycosyltransferase involved in cell wall biosynthesis